MEGKRFRQMSAIDRCSQARYDFLSYWILDMPAVKIAITMDEDLLVELDRLVAERQFPSRSRAVQEAVRDKLERLQKSRLARECARLDPKFEQALAEEGLSQDVEQWPEY
jgi:Arc/MetJ-type ribon-helix-helix transcriptional regulator